MKMQGGERNTESIILSKQTILKSKILSDLISLEALTRLSCLSPSRFKHIERYYETQMFSNSCKTSY